MRLMQAHHLENPSHERKPPIATAVAAVVATTRHVLAVSLPQQGQGAVRLPGDPSNGQFWVQLCSHAPFCALNMQEPARAKVLQTFIVFWYVISFKFLL